MKDNPKVIPKDCQLYAMATESTYELLAQYGHGADFATRRRLFTATPNELVAYLREHMDLAERLLEKGREGRLQHEGRVLEKRGEDYVTYEMDHDTPAFVKNHGSDLADGATRYLLMQW